MDKDNKGLIVKQDFILFAVMAIDGSDRCQLSKSQTDLIQALINKNNLNQKID